MDNGELHPEKCDNTTNMLTLPVKEQLPLIKI
jgi:hypothetical protein